MKLSRKVASIAITSAAALTMALSALSAQAAHADTYNGSEVTGHWTDAHGVAGYHVAGQADLVNNGGIWYQNGQEISVDGIIPGYHATETAPVPQQPAQSQPSTPTPSKPKADVPTTEPNQHVETDSTNKSHELHQTDTAHGVQQLASTPDDTSKIIYPVEEGKAHAAANPNYSDDKYSTAKYSTAKYSTAKYSTAKYSDTHSVLPQTGVANTIGLVAMGVAAICSALSTALLLSRDRNNRRK